MLILAPMQGLTELMFRKTYHQCFPEALDAAVSPFLSITHGNLNEACRKINDVLPDANRDSIPVIPQILGKEPDEFVGLANRLHELGYDEVNWNIGCPMRRVTAKLRGSGILPHPDKVRNILDSVVPRLKPRLSIKMRLGLSSPDDIFALVPVLSSYPLANITIHPRTGRQQYAGQVDLDTFEQAYRQFQCPIVYNGDLCTPEDYRRLRRRFPDIDDFMIGRGILYDPILPLKIKGIVSDDDRDAATLAARRFATALLDAILACPTTDESKMRKTKEYWSLLHRSLPIAEQQARTVLRQPTLRETLAALHDVL